MLTWFEAEKLLLNDKKGMPALQLQRHLQVFKNQSKKTDVSYKCAWRILKQIRMAMGNEKIIKMSHSIIEPDETYIGPKSRKIVGKKNKRGRGTNKTPICGFYDRYLDRVRAKVMTTNKNGTKISGEQIKEFIDEYNSHNTTLYTDEYYAYNLFDKFSENEYTRECINHSEGQYSNGKGVHTNHIEGFWSTMKRGGLHRRYHRIGIHYQQNYVNEYCFRFNHRNESHKQMFDALLRQTLTNKKKENLIKRPKIEYFSYLIQTDSLYERFLNNFSLNLTKSTYCTNFGMEVFVLERHINDFTCQIWQFLDDFDINDALEFLDDFDKDEAAA